jgi:hypothetical protein
MREKEGSPGSEPGKKPESLGGKVFKAITSLTIESSLLVHMTASFMGNLLLKNLLLYKACHVNLGYPHDLCEQLVDKAIKNK